MAENLAQDIQLIALNPASYTSGAANGPKYFC
jgi:hypothetical protein